MVGRVDGTDASLNLGVYNPKKLPREDGRHNREFVLGTT